MLDSFILIDGRVDNNIFINIKDLIEEESEISLGFGGIEDFLVIIISFLDIRKELIV